MSQPEKIGSSPVEATGKFTKEINNGEYDRDAIKGFIAGSVNELQEIAALVREAIEEDLPAIEDSEAAAQLAFRISRRMRMRTDAWGAFTNKFVSERDETVTPS
jgi:hypothetical protein